MRRALRVGLTGGIASGKTTVARIFAEAGAFVVDADELARAVTSPGGGAYDAVVSRFGPAVVDDDGGLLRDVLGRIVFADERARRDLERIVHPQVRAEWERRVREHERGGAASVAVLDAALLVETGAWRDFDRLVVVHCSVASQLERLRLRDGLDEASARARVRAQAPLGEKLAVADYAIDTEGSPARTRRETLRVWADLSRHAGR